MLEALKPNETRPTFTVRPGAASKRRSNKSQDKISAEVIRLFNAAYASHIGAPQNELFESQLSQREVSCFFDLSPKLRVLPRDRFMALSQDLESFINEKRSSFSLRRSDFHDFESLLLRASRGRWGHLEEGLDLFGDVAEMDFTCSHLEYRQLLETLRWDMRRYVVKALRKFKLLHYLGLQRKRSALVKWLPVSRIF